MRLLRVEIANFKTISDKQTLNLSNRGLVCIVGNNGAGKTTLEDSLVWAFSGRTLNGLKGNDVVNEYTGRNCHVRVRFQDAHGHHYRIDRYRKHKRFRNRLFLWQKVKGEWVDKSRHETKDIEAEIRKVTRLDFTSLVVSMVVGQGILAPFSAMSAPEQSRVIDTITGNDVVQSALQLVRERKNKAKDVLDDLSHDVRSLTTRCAEVQESLKKAQNNACDQAATKKGNIDRARQALAKARGRLKEALAARREASRNTDRAAKLQKRLDAVRKEHFNADTKKTAAQLERRNFHDQLEHYDKVWQSKDGKCAHCGSKINKATIRKLHAQTKERWRTAYADYEEWSEKVKLLRTEWDRLAKQIRELDRAVAAPSITAAEDDVAHAKQHLTAVRDEEPTWSIAAAEAKKLYKKLVKELKRKRARVVKAERRLEYLLQAEREYSHDIPLDIQDASLPFLNRKAERFGRIITDGVIDVEFTTEKTNKSGNTKEGICVATRNNSGGSKYVQQSKGEKQKIDLVVASSIQALNNEMARAGVNTRFYDEPFDSLDAASIERVMQFLLEELKSCESVFVITHNVALQSHFNNVIEVSKPKGHTIIREG